LKTVLHISPDIEFVSGRTKSVFNYLKILKNNGYDVILLTNGGNAISFFEEYGFKILISPVNYPSYGPQSIIGWLKYINKIITNNEVDIIHSHHRYFEYLSYLLRKYSKNKKLKLITTVHSIHSKKYIYPRFPSDAVIAVSNSIKNNLTRVHIIPESRMYVIYNCIDSADVNYISNHDNEIPVLFSAGWFSRDKGFDIVFEAIRKIKCRFQYILIGTGPEEIKYMEKAKEIGPNVIIKSPESDISSYYLNCDICIIPSRTEGLSYIALESGKFSVPVIASDSGGIPEIITDNETGILFRSNDPVDLTEKILILIKNTELRKQLAVNLNRKVLNEFNEKKFAEKLLKLYESVQSK